MDRALPKSGRMSCITSIQLTCEDKGARAAMIARDRRAAIEDLAEENHFQPLNDDKGPYHLQLSIEENRLVFRMTNAMDEVLPLLGLSLKPYARIVKDYFMIMESFEAAINDGKPSRIEAIDMGRRGLHNEGAALLKERLGDKITMDHNTARRLFTLICVLHTGKTRF